MGVAPPRPARNAALLIVLQLAGRLNGGGSAQSGTPAEAHSCCLAHPVNASCFGWSDADSTHILQAAIDCGTAEVLVPKMRGPWVLSTPPAPRPSTSLRSSGVHAAAIYLRSHLKMVLEEGVTLQAKRGSFHGLQDSLIMGTSITSVSIVGLGAGATLRMYKNDYANASLCEFAGWELPNNRYR